MIIDNLRPVEALYILDHAGKENISKWSSLDAVLGYLTLEGYISQKEMINFKKKGKELPNLPKLERKILNTIESKGNLEFNTLRESYSQIDYRQLRFALIDLELFKYIKIENKLYVTDKGKDKRNELRQYEINCLGTIAQEKENNLTKIINETDFGDFLCHQGFFKSEIIEKRKGILKKTHKEYLPTEKYNQALKELDELKEQINTAISESKKDKYLMAMSLAYPSSGLCYIYLGYPAVGDDSSVAAANAACIAAVIAATL